MANTDESSAPLVLREFGGKIEITQDAWRVRDEALSAARQVKQVKLPEEQTTAVEALRKLKALRQGMEATRKAVKAPVLELGRVIDNTAGGFLQEVTAQEGRLQGMINHFQKKQLEAKREGEDILFAKASHAHELESKAQELRHNAVFTTDPAKKQALLDQANQLERDAIDSLLTAELSLTVPVVAKDKGLVVKQRINFKVIDAIVFCQAYPQFWKWHPETETLKLDRMRVLDELNKEKGLFRLTRFPEELARGEDQRLVRPAGLEVFEETKAHVR